jgi:hypothetical protein
VEYDDGVTLRITGVLDFVHRPEFKKLENAVLETGSASILRRKEEDAYSVGPLRKSY